MDRSQKEKQVAELRDIFASANLVVLTHQTGLTVAQSTDLRAKMRDAGARFKVTKNRLARLALEGTEFAGLADEFKGPTAIAYSEDPVAAAKVIVDFAKLLDAGAVQDLAKLPSLDELRAKLVGMIQTPATRIAGVTQAPAGQLARVFGAYGNKQDAA